MWPGMVRNSSHSWVPEIRRRVRLSDDSLRRWSLGETVPMAGASRYTADRVVVRDVYPSDSGPDWRVERVSGEFASGRRQGLGARLASFW